MEKFNAFLLIKQQYKDISRNPINSFGISVGLINDNDIFNWRLLFLVLQILHIKMDFLF